MRRTRLLAGSLLALFMLGAGAASEQDGDAHRWLDKMDRASKTLNYDGTFVYRHGDRMDTMRIIHRVDEAGERVRLVSLNGAAREVLRDQSKVTCIQPDNQSVLVEKRHVKGPFTSAFRRSDERFREHYKLSLGPTGRVAGRVTQRINIVPHDEFRYGYRLWLERDTGLLLKYELYDARGESLEEVLYTHIEMPAEIPDSLLEPGISGKDYTWFRRDENAGPTDSQAANPGWLAAWLPTGFSMSSYDTNPTPTSGKSLEHMVYTDGLASFSVYVEPIEPSAEQYTGMSQMGAVNVFGAVVDDFQVTVVGDVPRTTVAQVGRAVRRNHED